MPNQLNLILPGAGLNALPSAKARKKDRAGVHGWTEFYASFSENFVIHALRSMGAARGQTIYDPFVGSGTTIVGALRLGMRSVGADIDPFACLLSRAKTATRAEGKIVSSLLKGSRRRSRSSAFLPEAVDIFSTGCLDYAGTIFDSVLRRTGLTRETVLTEFLHDSTGAFDSEIVAITSVCIAASRAARLVKGSNPTWFRQTKAGEQVDVPALHLATSDTVDRMLIDLKGLAVDPEGRDSMLHNVDARKWPLQSTKPFADFVVTSPPYLTRIDYVIKHLPNLMLLSGLTHIALEDLREGMVGTSKILGKTESATNWGATASALVAQIRDHPSYASARYYRWIHQQYFSAMYDSLETIARATKPNGQGIIVVQDSFYKDIYIDLGAVVVEMLSTFALASSVIQSEPIKTNLRRLNPRRSLEAQVTNERVIYFKKDFL